MDDCAKLQQKLDAAIAAGDTDLADSIREQMEVAGCGGAHTNDGPGEPPTPPPPSGGHGPKEPTGG